MDGPQSFTARRSAASNLPNFQLPPPNHLDQMHKYPAYAPSSTTQPTPALASSVLTPPAGLQSDLSPMASSVNSGSSVSSSASGPPYGQQQVGFWPTPQSSYTYSSAPPMPPSYAGQPNYIQGGRPLYSPSMNFPPNRNTGSPTAGEGLPPPYDLPYPGSMPMSGSGGGQQPQSLPNLAPGQQQQAQQQQAQQQQQQQQQQQAQQQAQQQQQQQQAQQQAQQHQQQQTQQHQQHHPQQSTSQAPPQGPLHAPDSYGGRPPPTPYYTPSSTPQQGSFPAYAQQSPTQQSPNTSSAPSNRISPVSAQNHSSMAAPPGYRPYNGYNLPAIPGPPMGGPIMSNVHQPGTQMSLVNGMNMQYPQHQMSGPLYGHHPGQQAPQNDRPFKCDQCPQSFNRNHDLKRHKRIHLAVKPFPCGHCEKSFSRKDALKRHILVKGCGKGPQATNANGGSQSPTDKDGVMSDSPEESPKITKKEL